MTPETFAETPSNDLIVLRLFRRGDDTAEIARLFRTPEAQITRMLHRARDAEQAEKRDWQRGGRP